MTILSVPNSDGVDNFSGGGGVRPLAFVETNGRLDVPIVIVYTQRSNEFIFFFIYIYN